MPIKKTGKKLKKFETKSYGAGAFGKWKRRKSGSRRRSSSVALGPRG